MPRGRKWAEADAVPVTSLVVRNSDVRGMHEAGTFDAFWRALGEAQHLLASVRNPAHLSDEQLASNGRPAERSRAADAGDPITPVVHTERSE